MSALKSLFARGSSILHIEDKVDMLNDHVEELLIAVTIDTGRGQ